MIVGGGTSFGCWGNWRSGTQSLFGLAKLLFLRAAFGRVRCALVEPQVLRLLAGPNEKTRRSGFFRYGAPARTRTWNPRLRRPVLYPVELRARMICWPFGSGESACILHEFRSLAMGSARPGGIASIVKALALCIFLVAIMFVRGSGAAYSGVHP